MVEIKKERHVYYNYRRSKDNLGCNEWWWLIINQNREITEIKDKIYELFVPIIDEKKVLEGVVKNTGLRYNLLTFDSEKLIEFKDLKEVYTKVTQNPALYRRVKDIKLEDYLADKLER